MHEWSTGKAQNGASDQRGAASLAVNLLESVRVEEVERT